MILSDIHKESKMERHTNAGHRNTRVIFWLISLLVLVASPSLAQAAITCGEQRLTAEPLRHVLEGLRVDED